jgi:hypothetical protein
MTAKSVWQTICKWAILLWHYTVAHPFTWDISAAVGLYTTATLGWFKPWVPGALLLYLLGRIWMLRREIKRIKH